MRKCIILKPILFVMFGNLKLEQRIHTRSYGICMSASLILFTYMQDYHDYVKILAFRAKKPIQKTT